MWRWIAVLIFSLMLIIAGFSLIETEGDGSAQSSALLGPAAIDTTGFARADAPREWSFPQDFGPHPAFQTEWWYYTGNLAGEDGRRFGYQFTIFRRALTPDGANADASEWRSNDVYMAHLALTDVAGDQFFHDERFSRGGAGLAGATADPAYRVWLDDWQVIAQDAEAAGTRITAEAGDYALDLTLMQTEPPALQGDHGLSAKSDEPGNASYYYSLTRLPTAGTVTINGQPYAVEGLSWKDHEFGSSALGESALGWDWFGLQLDDGRDLMLGQIRLRDGGTDPSFAGLLVDATGETRVLPAGSFSIEETDSWTSPHSGATYPAGWSITVNPGGGESPLRLVLTPQIADQELYGSGIAYWEGSVRITGDADGYGYAELTGYADSMTGRL